MQRWQNATHQPSCMYVAHDPFPFVLLLLFFSLNPRVVKDLIHSVLVDQLKSKEYDQNETGTWTKDIATQIKAKLKELKLPRYKFLVQVIIGEMKGAGVRSEKEISQHQHIPTRDAYSHSTNLLLSHCGLPMVFTVCFPVAVVVACGISKRIRLPRRPFRM